jgi:anti-anti-sigma factor
LHGFEVFVRVRDRLRVTLVLRGEFDVSAADLFTGVVTHQLRAGRRYIAIDMAAVTFIDCAMLRAVVAAHNQLLGRRGHLTLRHLSRPVARILDITGLDTALRIVASPGEEDPGRVVTMAPPV